MSQTLEGEHRTLAEKNLSWIVKGGLFLIPLIPLLITRSMYFPFITGKNFAFRILIEILAVFWVWLMAISPRFRPRVSLLMIAYSAFIGVLILATLFGLSPYKSVWSTYERMEGLFGHLHLFLYFLMLGSVFIKKNDWQIFFNVSIAVSAVVTIYGFVQLSGGAVIHQGGTRLDATMGNAAYLAVYLLFHLFLIAIFFFQTEKLWLKGVYGALFLMEAAVLYYTASRGPLLGFLAGATLFALILAVLERGRVQRVAVGVLAALLLVPALFLLVKDTEFVSSSGTLARFVNMVSDPVVQGRLTIWKMAFQGWQERPILGWGQESFTYIFSKYYDPSLWRNEPWFDRAHNVFLDWLTASGVLGLAVYLAIFGSALFLCWQAFRRESIDRFVFAGITSLLAAHFLQNFLIFDNLTSYLMFFGVIAWIHRSSLPDPDYVKTEAISLRNSAAVLFFVGLAIAVVGYSLFMFNIKPALAARSIIRSLMLVSRPDPAGKTDLIAEELRRGIHLNTFGTTEIREQANHIGNFILGDPGIAQQDKKKYLDFVIEELEKQREKEPFDVRAMAFLSNAYSAAGKPDKALAIIDKALAISSKRQQFYFVAAEAHLSSNRPDKAIEVLRIAYELDPKYTEAVHNLAIVLIVSGRVKEGEDFIEKHFGTRIFADQKYAAAYRAIGDLAKMVQVREKLVAGSPKNAQYRADLGSAYFQVGQKEKAIAEFSKAIELEPGFKAQGEKIIYEIKKSAK